jgi:protein-S-isoprenylcysteine O-methyltransferase Ste14
VAFDLEARPNRIPWPPLIYAGAALAAFAIGLGLPLPIGATGWLRSAGWVVMAAGLGLDLWAMGVMVRARTNILPNRAAARLVEAGPFAWSRNPIYTGNTTLLIGLGIAWNSLWFIVLALVAAALVQRLAIEREEAHLALLFGAQWDAYAGRTPRWIGPRNPTVKGAPPA